MEEISDALFGRYQALATYDTIARLAKPEFATREVATLAGIPTPAVSKELARLVGLGVIRSVSRRGEYERVDETEFWTAIELLGQWARRGK